MRRIRSQRIRLDLRFVCGFGWARSSPFVAGLDLTRFSVKSSIEVLVRLSLEVTGLLTTYLSGVRSTLKIRDFPLNGEPGMFESTPLPREFLSCSCQHNGK